MKKIITKLAVVAVAAVMAVTAQAESFKDIVGNTRVGPTPSASGVVEVPFIFWGGDYATFYANGGLETQPNSIFGKLGLKIKLVQEDNFPNQVRNYLGGKSPFLRGTFHMGHMPAEVINGNPMTEGQVLFQMTWSAGDHLVAKQGIKVITDLKGKVIGLNRGGPHEGFLYGVLKDAKLTLDDVTIKWYDNLTGPGSAVEAFRNGQVDVCGAITPDMFGLTGSLQGIGSGLEGTVKGAKVLVSTAERSRSIADVYIVSRAFFEQNRDWCTKFTAGYLKACEEVIDHKKAYEKSGSKEFDRLLNMAQKIYGKDLLPTIDEDAYGLIADCSFVGHPGNVKFFTQENNLVGFDAFQAQAMSFAKERGYTSIPVGLAKSKLDWNSKQFTGFLNKTEVVVVEKFQAEAVLAEIEMMDEGGFLDDNTVAEVTAYFQPNQADFPVAQYSVQFMEIIQKAATYGNAVFAIRGHSDPSKTIMDTIKAGREKGIIKTMIRTRDNREINATRRANKAMGETYVHYLNGRPMNLQDTDALIAMIESGKFDGASANPRQTMQAAANLSRKRAEAFKATLIQFAKDQGQTLDESQLTPVGAGITEPMVAKPKTPADAEANMRVGCQLVRVSAESTNASDFDF